MADQAISSASSPLSGPHSRQHCDFFISRAGADSAFALWIAKLIRAQGRSYILQDEHFGHADFMVEMHKALSSPARVVALYSQAYLDSTYCVREATEWLKDDPANERQGLIPLRIEPCAPGGMLNVTYTDLLHERRQAGATALALRILRALGFENPSLNGIPTPPAGVMERQAQITPEEFRLKTDHLAPRDDLIAGIAEALRNPAPKRGTRTAAITNSRHVMQAVAGMGGVGKTMLALDYARRNAGDYHGIAWIKAETRQGLLKSLADLGARIEPGVAATAVKDIEKAAARTLEIIEGSDFGRPWLLVYDNVEKPGDLDKLTPAAGAHVLVTTRWSDWHGLAGKVDVGVFMPGQAVEFLCDRAASQDREGAAALAEALGYLPLALDHAGSYCRSRRRSFDTYLDDVAALIKNAPKSGASFGQYPDSVFATFSIALERIIAGEEERGIAAAPEAALVMGLAAHLAPDAIPRALCDRLDAPSAGIDDALAAMAEVSLVTLGETDRGKPAFSVHRLVQLVAADLMGEHRQQFLDLALAIVDDAFPWESRDWVKGAACNELRTHAEAVLDHARTAGTETAAVSTLAQKLGSLLRAQAQYAAARGLFEHALAIADATEGAASHRSGSVLHDLAMLHQDEGHYGLAEPLLKRSISIKEKDVGPEHPDTSATLHELARLYQAQGRYSEAEPLLKRSLAICEKTVGGEHPSTSATLYELASLYQARGRYSEAEPLLKRSLAINEDTLGAEHPDTSVSLRQRAIQALETGRIDEAEAAIGRAFSIQQRAWGAEHPRLGQTLDPMALIKLARMDLPRAEKVARLALSLRTAKLPAEHPEIAQSRWTLARVLIAKGQRAAADPLLRQAIAALEAKVTDEHVWLKGARKTLAE